MIAQQTHGDGTFRSAILNRLYEESMSGSGVLFADHVKVSSLRPDGSLYQSNVLVGPLDVDLRFTDDESTALIFDAKTFYNCPLAWGGTLVIEAA